jgi:hypothetical protein
MAHAAFASGLRSAFLAAAVMGAVGGLAVLALVRRPEPSGGGHAAGPDGGQAQRSGAEKTVVPVES